MVKRWIFILCAFWTVKRIKSSCFLLSSDWNWFKRMDDFVFLCYFVSIFLFVTLPRADPFLFVSPISLVFFIIFVFIVLMYILNSDETWYMVHFLLSVYIPSCWAFHSAVRHVCLKYLSVEFLQLFAHILHTFHVPFFALNWRNRYALFRGLFSLIIPLWLTHRCSTKE